MNEEKLITCPNCGQQIPLDDKNLLKHLGRKGGLARNNWSKEKRSELARNAANKRWGKI